MNRDTTKSNTSNGVYFLTQEGLNKIDMEDVQFETIGIPQKAGSFEYRIETCIFTIKYTEITSTLLPKSYQPEFNKFFLY